MEIGFLVSLLQIAMVNVVLSGDNAVVIALAARNLPPRQQKKAILWGCAGALILRILLSVAAIEILKIPFLQFFGALLLVWIAVKLLIEDEEDTGERHPHKNLLGAIKTIVVADIIMSLDNTLAIAGVANGDWTLVIVGLSLSIPLIVFGSTIIMKLMDRYPVIVYVGAGLIAWTSGAMIDDDKAIHSYLPQAFHDTPYLAALATAGVIAYGWWYNKKKGRSARQVLAADETAAKRIEDEID